MGAGAWKVYESAKSLLGEGLLDLSSGTFNMALFLSTSNANALAGSSGFADLTNEVANANGYLAGGQAMTSVSFSGAGGIDTFTAAPTAWTASRGPITARFAVIYKVGTFGVVINPIVAACLLDTTPTDVTASDGNPFTITMDPAGAFTLSGATDD